jgi:CheY-like chemotaxis protein
MKEDADIRILVIDDEEVMGYLIRRVLEDLGYQMDWVKDCQSAWEKIKAHYYHVIISDYRLPGMTGEAFYEQLFKHNQQLARKMIFISGDTVNRQTLTFFKRIRLPYFSKPFPLEDLKKAIQDIVAVS